MQSKEAIPAFKSACIILHLFEPQPLCRGSRVIIQNGEAFLSTGQLPPTIGILILYDILIFERAAEAVSVFISCLACYVNSRRLQGSVTLRQSFLFWEL